MTDVTRCDVHLSKYGTWVCLRCGYEPRLSETATWQFVAFIPNDAGMVSGA